MSKQEKQYIRDVVKKSHLDLLIPKLRNFVKNRAIVYY